MGKIAREIKATLTEMEVSHPHLKNKCIALVVFEKDLPKLEAKILELVKKELKYLKDNFFIGQSAMKIILSNLTIEE